MKIRSETVHKIYVHCHAGYPFEVCGLLISDGNDIVDSYEVRNTTDGNKLTTYAIDPLDLIRVDDFAEERGLEVIGNYHSHPNHSSTPSETDRKSAVKNWIYAIIALDKSKIEMKFWRMENGYLIETVIDQE